jgi:hypothetical protein
MRVSLNKSLTCKPIGRMLRRIRHKGMPKCAQHFLALEPLGENEHNLGQIKLKAKTRPIGVIVYNLELLSEHHINI